MANMTLVELAKRQYGGAALRIAEVLAERNELFTDAVWTEGNSTTGDVYAQRTAQPNGTWRKINQGVASSSSSTKQLVESYSMLQARSVIDKKLVDLAADSRMFRQSEDEAFVAGMSESFVDGIFYGDTATDPEQPLGLANRYNALSNANVTTASGTSSDQTSMWIVQWGTDKTSFVYPRGTTAGVSQQDLGEIDALDASNNSYRAYATLFDIMAGLRIKDPRCVQRICNVDTGTYSTTLDQAFIKALNKLPDAGPAVVYMNQTAKTIIELAIIQKTNLLFAPMMYGGIPVPSIQGKYPIRRLDALLNTESQVS